MTTMPVSAATEAEVAKLYPHATNAELASAFRLTARQVQHIGTRHKLLKTRETLSLIRSARPASGETILSRIRKAAAAAGELGLSKVAALAALPGSGPAQVERALHKLTAEGQLHRAGRKGAARWFAQREWADAFNARVNAPKPRAAATRPASTPGVVIAATPGPAQQPGAPRVDDRTHITLGKPVPGPEARWHANARPHFAGRVGQYDSDAPASCWVTAITTRTQEAR